MGRTVLQFYVAISVVAIIFVTIETMIKGVPSVEFSDRDWLIFILACGALAISESLEQSK